MPNMKPAAITRLRAETPVSSGRLARTGRGLKIGLVMIIWLGLLGWIGISSYNVIRLQYSPVYARDRAAESATGDPRGEAKAGTSTYESAPSASPGLSASPGVLLTAGTFVFFLATGIRLLVNRRKQNDT